MRQFVFGRSMIGASHIRSGMECQDSCKKVILEDGTIILAAADGHGSKDCPYSRTGSKIAANVFCDIMKGLYADYDSVSLATYLNREGEMAVSRAIDAEWKRRVLERHRKNKREKADKNAIYKQYGTTLLGLMLTSDFVFAFQLGDGDICYVSDEGFDQLVKTDKILGVETHSLSREKAWQKATTVLRRIEFCEHLPAMFSLSTDGYANSYKSEEGFHEAVSGYFELINEHGAATVEDAMPAWLSETSEMGCGDDISMLIAYFTADEDEAVGVD